MFIYLSSKKFRLAKSYRKIFLTAKGSMNSNMFYFIIVLEIGFYKVMDLVYWKVEAHNFGGYITSRTIQ